MSGLPLLTLLTLTPLVGAAIVAGLDPRQRSLARGLGLFFNGLALVLVAVLWASFNAGNGEPQFVERHDWIPSVNVHYFLGLDGMSLLMVLLTALIVPFGLLASWRIARFAPWRRTSLYLVLCLAIAPTIVTVLKVITHRHCPWGITRYGGEVPWSLLFEFAPAGISGGNPGRCLPAAHASSALGLLGLYFVGRALRRPRPWLWALPGIVLGCVFALGQQVRGAHFFSHNLWALAVCWSVALALYYAFGGRIAPRREPTTATETVR